MSTNKVHSQNEEKSEEDRSKYIVYRNDIKFKNYRKIDPEKAIWASDNVKKDFMKYDTDKLEYRLKECRREKYQLLDLSHTTPDVVNEFFSSDFYKRHIDDIQHLCMSHSNLSELPDLHNLINLETVDISANDLTEIPKLPGSILELIANDNKIESLNKDKEMNNLTVLNVSHNRIKKIPKLKKVRKLNISHNRITTLSDSYPNVVEFICDNNKNIIQLPGMPKVESLDCSDTKVTQIFDYMNLKYIIWNRCNINKLKRVPQLDTLEIIDTNLDNLDYFPNLKTLYFSKSTKFLISDEYTVKSTHMNKKNIYNVYFE
jgi:Leucine-rich repeat (LRR) protein